MDFHALVGLMTRAIEAAGVGIPVVGTAGATVLFVAKLKGGAGFAASYELYRQWLGRAILLGLEFLVAADIAGTVAVSPSLTDVAVLGGIVPPHACLAPRSGSLCAGPTSLFTELFSRCTALASSPAWSARDEE